MSFLFRKYLRNEKDYLRRKEAMDMNTKWVKNILTCIIGMLVLLFTVNKVYATDINKDNTTDNDKSASVQSNNLSNITIDIKDTENNELSSIQYMLYDESDKNVSEGTIESGTIMKNLIVGREYKISLQKEGYIVTDKTFSVAEDSDQIIDLTMTQVKVTIKLYDAEDQSGIKGASFRIENSNGDKVKEFVSEAEGNNFIDLSSGEYSLIQEKATNGYVKTDVIKFTVSGDKVDEITVNNNRVNGYLDIYLVTSLNRTPIPGGEFKIFRDGTEIETVTLDGNGHGKTSNLPIGSYENGAFKTVITYQIKQNATPEEYEINSGDYEFFFDYLGDETSLVYKTFTMPNVVKAGETLQTKTVAKDVTEKTSETQKAQTGETYNESSYIVCTLAAFTLLVTMIIYKLKNKKNNKGKH